VNQGSRNPLSLELLDRRYATIAPMAKKKNTSKKHRFKHAEQAPAIQPTEQAAVQAQPKAVAAAGKAAVAERDFSYVAQDLRRIALLGGALVLLQLLLAYLISNTGVGSAIYRLIQI
jgi:hypothetical protein